jgi:hypothetical protein
MRVRPDPLQLDTHHVADTAVVGEGGDVEVVPRGDHNRDVVRIGGLSACGHSTGVRG